MTSQELIIHIDWSGPHTFSEVSSFDSASDFGIYQVYGAHHVYGSDVLLYIGKAQIQTFSARLAQHGWCANNHDAGRLQFYIGRLFGGKTPDNSSWEYHIDLAERLLIQAHTPTINSQKELVLHMDSALQYVHVLNWSQYRDLMPEVSGARWSSRFDNLPCKPHFTTADNIFGASVTGAEQDPSMRPLAGSLSGLADVPIPADRNQQLEHPIGVAEIDVGQPPADEFP